MKRFLPFVLAALVVAAYPAAAGAAGFRGVVVARDGGTALVASPSGVVRAFHASPRVGSRVVLRGSRLAVVGRAHFIYLSAGQRAIALPLGTLQAMSGPQRRDQVSLFMVRSRDGADVEGVRRWIERRFPRVTAISTATALRQVDERLSYFRQLSFILGAVSLAVGFLLVTTLVTVSVNERLGEIAVLRAIGVSRVHVVQQIVLEGVALMFAGAALGLALGLVTARYLNAILSAFPGLPAAIDFFLFQPRAAWSALGLLVLSGLAAGVYPAWRGASLPIAQTLRQEAVG
jgi:putative ABC transport system permease protein